MKVFNPLIAIRRNCVECSGSFHPVKYCPCYGAHSTRCHLWPCRFGKRPKTAAAKYGETFVTPGSLPAPNVMIEDRDRVVAGEVPR